MENYETGLDCYFKGFREDIVKESGYYPPGAEFHPDAPWNQKPSLDPDDVAAVSGMACELFDAIQKLKDDAPGYFDVYQPMSKSLADCQKIIDSLKEVKSEIL